MIKRRKILIILPAPFKSGTQLDVYLRIKAISMSNPDADITLLTFPYGKNILLDNLKIVRYPKFKLFKEILPLQYVKVSIYSFFLLMKLFILKKEDYDVVFAFLTSYFYAHFFRRKFNSKIISTIFGNLSEYIGKWHLKILYVCKNIIKKFDIHINNKYDKIIFGNELVMKELLKSGINNEKAVLIPFAFEKNEIIINYEKNNLFTVLYTGIFDKIQNLSLIIDAAVILKNTITDININLIGASDSDYKRYIDIIERKNISEIINIKKRINHNLLNKYFMEADVLISSRIEGVEFPMKIFEYLSYGKCILATNRPIHTGVLDENNACLFEPNPEDLAEKIVFLKKNPGIVKNYGKNAYNLYKERYSLNRMVDDYNKLIISIVK